MKAIKIMLNEYEMEVIDCLIEELVKTTKIEATRTAIVRGMFKNGLEFYTKPTDWMVLNPLDIVEKEGVVQNG